MDQPSSSLRASTHPWIIRLLSVLPLLLAGGGCGLIRAPAASLTPPMPVQAPLRKQVLQGYMPFGSIDWVNNELVVFSGRPIGSEQRDALFLWDTQKAPRPLLEHSPGGCASEGTIFATQLVERGEDKRFKLEAPDFKPRPLIATKAPAKSKFEAISCSSIPTPKTLEGRIWEPLRKGEGFLDFGPNKAASGIQPVSHLTADLNKVRVTGIRMEQPLLPQAVHAAHNGSYLIFDLHQAYVDQQRWIETNQRTIWRLDHQKKGTPLNVPAGPWVGIGAGTIAFLPSHPGLLITSKNFARNHEAGGAGLYLLPPDKPAQRLERGLVEDAAISPDGCRIAYGFRPRLDTGIPEGGPRLVVLDLCSPRGITRR